MKKAIILTTLLLLSVGNVSFGQVHDSILCKPLIHQIEFDFAPGYVFQTHDFFKGVNLKDKKIDKDLSFHLKYAFQFAPDSYFGKLYPHTYQGIGVSYNTFFNTKELGNPVALYVFQGSRIKQLATHLSLDYEWNFGASFGWKPYDADNNWNNTMVGSKINAYLSLGLLLNWQMNRQWRLITGVTATHYSNGNTHCPNAGVNIVGVKLGVTRVFDASYDEALVNRDLKLTTAPHLSYDVVIFGATRSKELSKESVIIPGNFGIVGFNFNPMYNFNKYFGAGISLDGEYDESANIEKYEAGQDQDGNYRFYRPPFRERVGVGLSLRGELTMPIFSINLGVGHNMFYKGSDWGGFYQILALKTHVTRHIFLHAGYQLSKCHDPKNLMLGVGYHFY
jgi:hypothetical protein